MSSFPCHMQTDPQRKTSSQVRGLVSNERGVAAVVMALMIFVLTALASFAIDVGYALVTHNELQNIADAGALAATRQLGVVYAGLTPEQQKDKTRSLTADERAQMLAVLHKVAGLNKAGGKSGIVISASDISMGTWDFSTKTLNPTFVRPTAVSVTARRDGNANGPIRTFFASVMGVSEMNVAASATATLGPLGSLAPGEGGIPVGISKRWFDEGRACGDAIKFHPTGTLDGCAGWHTFKDGPANANGLKKILAGLEDGSYTSPAITAGQTELEFTGGTLASAFDAMKSLYDAKKDPGTGEWEVKIPVYDSDDCSNPSGTIKIVGFATAKVTQVIEAPEKQIIAEVTCDEIIDGRPGGTVVDGDFSPLSTAPALVS